MRKRRWLVYGLLGMAFGVFDFYYQTFVNTWFSPGAMNQLVWLALILGVWLVVVIPAAWHEAKTTQSVLRAAFAGMLTWSSAVLMYYLYAVIKLVLIGEASRPEMQISNRGDPFYWANLKNYLGGDFIAGVSEWIGIAVVGGFIIGLLTGLISIDRRKRPQMV